MFTFTVVFTVNMMRAAKVYMNALFQSDFFFMKYSSAQINYDSNSVSFAVLLSFLRKIVYRCCVVNVKISSRSVLFGKTYVFVLSCVPASYVYPICKGCSVCSKDNGCMTCQPKLFLFLRRERMRQYGECLHVCPSGYYGTRGPEINMCSSKTL